MSLSKHASEANKREPGRWFAHSLGMALLGMVLPGMVCSGACAKSVKAQSAPQQDPALHKRAPGQPDPAPAPLKATGHLTLPPEAEGDYAWDKQGSVIDLFFEDGKLHGYLTNHLDPDPHVAPAVYDFQTSHADGHAVAWTTRVVHGTWFSFTGHLERGLVDTPAKPGYYLLAGTLTEHAGTDSTPRTVSLKREPGD